MKKNLTVLALSGALICTTALPAMAADNTTAPVSPPPAVEENFPLPDSVLYYGTVKEIVRDTDDAIIQLSMNSQRDGEYVMNISSQTVWIDSGKHTAASTKDLQVGENLYVFHDAAATRSLPPQSAAFAVVRNIPQDALCAQYHKVESVSTVKDGQVAITTNQGSLILMVSEDTELSVYGEDTKIPATEITADSHVMAWYAPAALSDPGQAHATHLMLLPNEDAAALTRGKLMSMLYEKAGKPVVNFSMNYSDISSDSIYAEAIRWGTSEGLVNGYSDGTFRPDTALNREQFVAIMWQYAGSPMLADYTGLSQFSDVGSISRFAQPAMAWAHQKGLITALADGTLSPNGSVTQAMAETFLNTPDLSV